MEVIIAKNYDEMSNLAAEIIADQVRHKPNSVLGLATGGTPIGTYQCLAKMFNDGKVDFAKITTFNLDEYLGIPNDHPERYYNFMWANLFQHINVPKDRIHVPTNILDGAESFCEWYEEQIQSYDGVDLQLLGIGPDGHIAFNEPSSSLASRTRIKTLDESTIEANARFFKNKKEVPRYAITMGVGTILEARKLLLIANGKKKAKICKAFIEGPVTSMVTASVLQLHPRATVILDEEAASELSMKDYFKWVYNNRPGAR